MIETTKTSVIQKLKKHVVCPVEIAIRVIGGKWRGSILYQLRNESLRYNELKMRVQDAVIDYDGAENYLTNKVLSGHLKDLMDYEMVEKKPLDAENYMYQLTFKGKSVIPILLDLFDWGETHFKSPSGNL